MTGIEGFGKPYWLDIPRPSHPVLEGDVTADAVIAGAGIFGLKVAHNLARHGVRAVILEGAQVGEGASGRNQGSANQGAAIGYGEAVGRYGRARARAIWQLGLENLRAIREQIEIYDIDCDARAAGFTYLARADMPGGEESLAEYRHDATLLEADGFAVDTLDAADTQRLTGSDRYLGGMTYRSDMQFHSGRYVVGLGAAVARLRGVSLFEHSRVMRMVREGGVTTVVTAQGSVTAPLVFLGLNALAPQQIRDLAGDLRAERGQVMVTAPLERRPCRGSYGTAMAWWREIIEPDGRFRLLFGGGRRRDEPDSLFRQYDANGRSDPLLETEAQRPSVDHQARLDAEFAKLFPQLAGVRIDYRWGGLQSFTADSFPEIGLFDAERNMWGAAGFSGRGNCYSDVAATYVVGKALGQPVDMPPRFVTLIEDLMAVRRPAAAWGPWVSAFDPPTR